MAQLPLLYDVAVVGAGLAGALVARRLADEGQRVAVLEARKVGASFRADASAMALLGAPELEALEAEDLLLRWRYTQHNLEVLTETATAVNVPLTQTGSWRAAQNSRAAGELERSAIQLERAGFEVSLEDLSEHGLSVALATEADLRFDPRQLVWALLDHPQIRVAEDTEVTKIVSGDEGSEVWARKHYLRSSTVVLAEGAHIVHRHPFLASLTKALPVQTMVVTARESLARPLLLERGRVLVQELGERWQLSAWVEETDVDPLALLVRTADRLCPEAQLLERHADWVLRSTSGMPLIGSMPEQPRVYFLAGLGPWGLSWVFSAAKALTAFMLEGASPPWGLVTPA